MSTLSDHSIQLALDSGLLKITPFDQEALQPASYDLHLANEFLRFSDKIDVTRPWEPQHLWEHPEIIADDGEFIVGPGEFVLGTTTEWLGLSNRFCAEIWGKSSLGRLGLSIHVTAGFVDPGFTGQITLEFFNVSPVPIALRPGMPICQATFTQLWSTATRGYDGKYLAQRGVTPSLYHLNFKE